MKSITRWSFGRRLFAALAASALRPAALHAQTHPALIAREGTLQLAPANYPQTQVWGYNGAVPGPTIRLPQGSRMTRRFENELPQPSTIHWNGIRIDNAMDRVPGLTQDVVQPGESFLYDFVVPDAGTYWYHPHNRSYEQMARGLSGVLVVEEADGGPEVDSDEVLLIDDTVWPHAMHLHGHHFRQIASDGTAGPLRDTLLMVRGETAQIAFVADNPGDWLLHCHMLEHSAGGMMTWLRVV